MYHIQFVSGTMAQTGHLAERLRILRKPVGRHQDPTHGWIVTASQGPLTEVNVRALLQQHGIAYPPHIPVVYGGYSISDPDWNSSFYHWDSVPNEWLPVWMQPIWWLYAHANEFPGDPMGIDISLAEWRARGIAAVPDLLTIQDIAREFAITARRARALAANRHQRFGIGQQLSGGQWVFRPEDLDILAPDTKYRHK